MNTDTRQALTRVRALHYTQVSIPSACGGWAETAAAYRFLSQGPAGMA